MCEVEEKIFRGRRATSRVLRKDGWGSGAVAGGVGGCSRGRPDNERSPAFVGLRRSSARWFAVPSGARAVEGLGRARRHSLGFGRRLRDGLGRRRGELHVD
jgi:hypothetical protein